MRVSPWAFFRVRMQKEAPDLTGLVFGKRTVIRKCDAAKKSTKGQWYEVSCSCGSIDKVPARRLLIGSSWQCMSCASIEKGEKRRAVISKKAGLPKIANPWINHARSTLRNAKLRGIFVEFSCTAEFAAYLQTIAPSRCPVLGTKLAHGHRPSENKYSIDRIDNDMGYMRGNLQVISYKANVMKSSATLSELRKFSQWVMRVYGESDLFSVDQSGMKNEPNEAA